MELTFYRVLKVFIVWKAIAVAVFVLLFHIVPLSQINWDTNAFGPYGQIRTLASAFAAWDGLHYLKLADHFYTQYDTSSAFYPLLPFLMRLPTKLGMTSFVSGMIWTTLLSFLALYYFMKVAESLLSPSDARRAVILFLCFPTAYYLTAIYSEGLFLALALSFTYYFAVRKSRWCLVPALLLPLSRGQGLMMVGVLFGYLVWRTYQIVKSPSDRKTVDDRVLCSLAMGGLVIGAGIYLWFMASKYGDPFAGFKAQQFYVFKYSIGNLLRPWRLFPILFSTDWNWFAYSRSGVDRLFFVLVLILGIPVLRSREPFMVLSYLVLAYTAAFMGELSVFSRMALSIFPVFFYAARALGRVGEDVFWAVIIVSVATQLFFIGRFVNFYWVA